MIEFLRRWIRSAFTAAEPEPERYTIDAEGLIHGGGAEIVRAHPSWHGGPLIGGEPGGIVCHVSATNHGTAGAMARRRARAFDAAKGDRLASWHVSIEGDGSVIQMVPIVLRAWHAGSSTARPVPGLGAANAMTIGIELIGWERGPFPEAQIASAGEVWRAIVRRYGIPRELAMITHQSIDPTRRSDPGRIWMAEYADRVLDVAYR